MLHITDIVYTTDPQDAEYEKAAFVIECEDAQELADYEIAVSACWLLHETEEGEIQCAWEDGPTPGSRQAYTERTSTVTSPQRPRFLFYALNVEGGEDFSIDVDLGEKWGIGWWYHNTNRAQQNPDGGRAQGNRAQGGRAKRQA